MPEDDKFYDDEDAAAPPPSEKNWKGIIIAILVICFVLGMIITSVLLLTPPDEGPRVRGERMTLTQVLGEELRVKEFNGTWISGNEFAFQDTSGGLSVFNADNLTSRVLISNVTLRQFNVEHFNVSSDLRFVLLSEKAEEVQGFSFGSKYHIYEISSMHVKPLTHKPEDRDHPSLVYAKWSPKGSALVMVDLNYNIYFKKAADDPEAYQITNSGEAGKIQNGAPDWMYETIILADRYAAWFSPGGSKLAYATFNDSMVDEVPILYYKKEKPYSTVNNIRYSKAGQTNPKVSLWVLELDDPRNSNPQDVKPPDGVKDQLVTPTLWDHYFTAVTWLDKSSLSIVWMNRAQNISVITICKPPMYFCEAMHTENSHHGWVDLYEAPIFSSDGQGFLVRLPVRNGDAGEFRHVNLYNMRLRIVTPITHGPFEVTEIIAWDHHNNYIYFMGTAEENPGMRHLYRVSDILTSTLLRTPECLSCFETENSTEKCLYNKAHISKDFSYFILECLGPNVPRTYLFSTYDLTALYTLNNYQSLREMVESSALPEVKTFRVELDGEPTYTAHVQLLLPPGLRENEITTYPMVVHACGSPGSQAVTSQFRIHYGTYLASNRGIIYAFIDGRGSGYQGDKIKHEVFLNLGDKEVADQLAVVHYLKENLHFIDEKRIVIWGWNYGGFVSTLALSRDVDELFSCGIAVAPITKWEYYSSVFTERYMGSPHVHPGSNYKGYEAADVTKAAGNLKHTRFLLVHGTADRNVHFQHSMMLARALAEEGVIFRQIIYPDEGNALNGVQEHLYNSIDKFLSDCFRPSLEELYFHIKKKKDLEELGYLSLDEN